MTVSIHAVTPDFVAEVGDVALNKVSSDDLDHPIVDSPNGGYDGFVDLKELKDKDGSWLPVSPPPGAMAVNVGEVALSDFYSRLILSKEGRLNLQDIVRKPEAGAQPVASAPEQAATAPAVEVRSLAKRYGRVRSGPYLDKRTASIARYMHDASVP